MNPQIPTYGNNPLAQGNTWTPPAGNVPQPNQPSLAQLYGESHPNQPVPDNWMNHLLDIFKGLHGLGIPFMNNVHQAVSNPDLNARAQQLQDINNKVNSYKTTQQQLNQVMSMK